MNRLEQIKTALGSPLIRTIGGQEVEFLPLPATFLPDFYEMAKMDQNNPSKEDFKKAVVLIIEMVKQAFPMEPSYTEDAYNKMIGQYVMKNFVELQLVLIELHSPGTTEDQRVKDRIEQLKKNALKKNEPAGQNQEQSK